MKTGGNMKLTPKFMEATVKELERAGITMKLEGGEGTFNVQGAGSDTITITVIIESHAVVSGNQKNNIKRR